MTKSELKQAYGTPDEFDEAVMRSRIDGYATFDEAMDASLQYEAEYREAPDDEPRSA